MAPSWRHRVEYAAVRAVAGTVGALPGPLARAAGSGIGLVAYAADARHRRLALANLEAAFPRRSSRERRAIARGAFAHFGRLLVELLRFGQMPPEAIRAHVEIEGAERVHQAHRAGRGAFFVTGHFGYWELHALAHGAELYPMALVARPLDNPLLHELLERVRTSTGNTVIYRRYGLRRILKALAANQGVAMLIDQHIQPADAVVVDFFGRPAATTAALAALALRTGAPVIPSFALPMGRGRYRLIYEPPVEPPPADHPDAIREFTQRCTDVLEMYVRRYPELWLWMHRRWREIDQAAETVLPDEARMGPE